MFTNISRHNTVTKNISASHGITGNKIRKAEDMEVFTQEAVNQYIVDLNKSIEDGTENLETIEKAKKELSTLTRKVITNKNGKQQTVFVRTRDGKASEFKHGDKIKFEHNGKHVVAEIHKLLPNDRHGTAIAHDDKGNVYHKSLGGVEHHGEEPKNEDHGTGEETQTKKKSEKQQSKSPTNNNDSAEDEYETKRKQREENNKKENEKESQERISKLLPEQTPEGTAKPRYVSNTEAEKLKNKVPKGMKLSQVEQSGRKVWKLESKQA